MSAVQGTRSVRAPKRTLAAIVTAQLRDRIIAGDLPPGTQMNEAELAARFATSRGPIREGMQRLVQEGLLVSAPHRGIFVPVLTLTDLEDLYFARAAVERAAALRVLDRGLTASAMATLERALEDMELALADDEPIRIAGADLQFHEGIVSAAGSPRLSQMFSALAGQTRLGLNLLVGSEDTENLLVEHTAVYRALVAGDSDQVLALLDRHFAEAHGTLSAKLARALDQGPDAADGPRRGRR